MMNSDEVKDQIREVWLKNGVCDSFYSLKRYQSISDEFYDKLVG